MRLFFIIIKLSLLSCVLAAIGPNTNLVIGNQVINPDGAPNSRSAVLAGQDANSLSFPGPLIQGVKNGAFRINVIDSLTDTSMLVSTSIHWHGFFQAGSSWADGPVGVNQCPIAPGNSFAYQFTAANQAGTFWYHSHHSTQYCDGLRGPLVVYDPNDPHLALYDFDDDTTVITLSDWYHVVAPQAGPVPTFDSTLINGIGRVTGGSTIPLAVITVLPQMRYRFRLVSLSCDPNWIFSIDGHTMTIIEADGVNMLPLTVDSIQIYAGQRYSFILNTNQPVDNYWIRANPDPNGPGTKGFDGGINSAILRYFNATAQDPTTTSTLTNPLVETNLHPLENPGAPGTPILGQADVNLNLDIQLLVNGGLAFQVNNATFTPPSVPALLQILSGARTAQELLPSGSVYTIEQNQVVEITINGGTPGAPHPFHLHGHAFDVIQSAGSSIPNYVNPVRRDVVNTGNAGETAIIRFRADNPGPWIMHCHIDWHLDLGLAIVFAESASAVGMTDPPDAWDQLCPTFDALPPQVFT